MKTTLIGLAGGSASGKTSFIHQISERFSNSGELCVISQDHYYRPLSDQVRDEKGNINFDRPEGIDFDRLRRDVKKLMAGKQVEIAEYTFNNPAKFPKKIIFEPSKILLVEGLFIFTDETLNDMFDLRLFIDADPEVAFQRRLDRDTAERGMTEDEVRYQWFEHVLPAYQQFLEPYRDHVDMVIVNNTHFQHSLEVLSSYFAALLQDTDRS